jgi:hypothetical protein
MNKMVFWVAAGLICAALTGFADVFASPGNVVHYLFGLAVGLWVYPLAEGRG